MASQPPTSGSGDEALANAPVEHPGSDARQINRAVTNLNTKFDHLTKPPTIRTVDFIQLAVIVIGIVAGLLTAIGIKDRMDDMRTRQSDMERRVDARVDRLEDHLDERLNRIDDRLGKAPTLTRR